MISRVGAVYPLAVARFVTGRPNRPHTTMPTCAGRCSDVKGTEPPTQMEFARGTLENMILRVETFPPLPRPFHRGRPAQFPWHVPGEKQARPIPGEGPGGKGDEPET